MTAAAVALVLGSAVIHATWNLLTKKAGGGLRFLWLFALVSAVVYGPYVAWLGTSGRLSLTSDDWIALGVSSAFHLGYILLLQRAYSVADLSVVYPVARGTGPLLASAVSILLLGERPSALGAAGIAAVCTGVFLMAGAGHPAGESKKVGVLLAALTGVFIAGYTLTDKYAVDDLAVHPVMVVWFEEMVRAIVLAPAALSSRAKLATVTRSSWKKAVTVGVLGPVSYILVLFAFRIAPASYVAPARELAIAVGAIFGMVLLREPRSWRRVGAVTAIVSGVILIAAA